MRFILPATLVVVLDQITKHVVWRNGQNYDIIDGYLHITLVKNAGAAFGLLQGGRVFFIIASVIAAVFIVYAAAKMPREQSLKRFYLAIILGGAIGNLIDRVLAGEVIDFIRIGIAGHYWPVFNVADMGVSIGAVLLLIGLLRAQREDDDLARAADATSPQPDPGEDPTARR